MPQSGPPETQSERHPRTLTTHSILLVDDHPAILDALADQVGEQAEFDVVELCSTGECARQRVRTGEVDVVVLDISLPDVNGLDLIPELHQIDPDLRVVVFSMHDESIFAERAIRAGAMAYVMKTESSSEVSEAIRGVLRGDIVLSQTMASRLLSKLVRQRSPVRARAIDRLTDREASVFRLMGEGLSIKEIAERLDLNRKTVETYRRRTKEKLGARSVNELLRIAVQYTGMK